MRVIKSLISKNYIQAYKPGKSVGGNVISSFRVALPFSYELPTRSKLSDAQTTALNLDQLSRQRAGLVNIINLIHHNIQHYPTAPTLPSLEWARGKHKLKTELQKCEAKLISFDESIKKVLKIVESKPIKNKIKSIG